MSALSILLSGCAYQPLTRSSIGYKLSGSLKARAAAAGESNIFVHGWLERGSEMRQSDVFVVALADNEEETEAVVVMPVGKNGYYGMFLPEARYVLSAFVDENQDGKLQDSEWVGEHQRALVIESEGPSAFFDVNIPVGSDSPRLKEGHLPDEQEIAKLSEPGLTAGQNLLSGRYAEAEGTLGMVSPNEFLAKHLQLQFVEEPDFTEDRVPVVLVHGINGTPQVFERLEETIDRNRFQPWFFYYPSGARLPSSAEVLHRYLLSGLMLPKMKSLALTAHSMGGLVCRSALNAYKRSPSPTPVTLYTSFVTPYGGVEEANIGVKNSPFRVPSWVDIASGSKFQSGLFTGLPEGTLFQLLAGDSEGDSDGTIRLSSQLFKAAVNEASSVQTFPADHVGIVSDDAALDAFFEKLAPLAKDVKVRPPVLQLERLRRAKLLFEAVEAQAKEASYEVRMSAVTATYQRVTLSRDGQKFVIQLAAGRGLRADIVAPKYKSFSSTWEDATLSNEVAEAEEGTDPSVTVAEALAGPDNELSALKGSSFLQDLLQSINTGSEAKETMVKLEPLAAALPVAPNVTTQTPPPLHLFFGLAGTLNLGKQKFSLRVPVEASMYFGAFGFGTDLRLPLFSPTIEADAGDLHFVPFGLGIGPRFRFGNRKSFLVGNVGLNFTTEFGRVQLTESGSGRARALEDVIDQTYIGAVGAYGSAHIGFKLAPDLYLRFGGDAGSLFSNLRVQIDEEEIVLLQPVFLNILAGLELRIP